MKEIEDRKKISELLTLANVLEEDVVLFKDVRPGINNIFYISFLEIFLKLFFSFLILKYF